MDEYEDDLDPDTSATAACPNCGEQVYEDSAQCPECGDYIDWDSASRKVSGWLQIVVWVLIAALLLPAILAALNLF